MRDFTLLNAYESQLWKLSANQHHAEQTKIHTNKQKTRKHKSKNQKQIKVKNNLLKKTKKR